MADNVVRPPTPRFGINEVVYLRESALSGFLEALKVRRVFYDPSINRTKYVFFIRNRRRKIQTLGDAVDLRREYDITLLEEDLVSYEEALLIKKNWLENELVKTDRLLQGIDIGPKIEIFGNGTEINDGDVTPGPNDDFTQFGDVKVSEFIGDGAQRAFEIRNLGNSELLLIGEPIIDIIGDQDFFVSSLPITIIQPGTLGVFRIGFKPVITGRRTAVITIRSNDPANSFYSFVVEGFGISAGGTSI